MNIFYLLFLTTIVVLAAIALSLMITIIIPNTHYSMNKEEKKEFNTTLVGIFIMSLLLCSLFYMLTITSTV